MRKDKEIIDIFQDYFFDKRCVIFNKNGNTFAYIVNKEDYLTENYYECNFWKNKYNKKTSFKYDKIVIPFPYLYCVHFYYDSTEYIIKELIKICMYINDGNKGLYSLICY